MTKFLGITAAALLLTGAASGEPILLQCDEITESPLGVPEYITVDVAAETIVDHHLGITYNVTNTTPHKLAGSYLTPDLKVYVVLDRRTLQFAKSGSGANLKYQCKIAQKQQV